MRTYNNKAWATDNHNSTGIYDEQNANRLQQQADNATTKVVKDKSIKDPLEDYLDNKYQQNIRRHTTGEPQNQYQASMQSVVLNGLKDESDALVKTVSDDQAQANQAQAQANYAAQVANQSEKILSDAVESASSSASFLSNYGISPNSQIYPSFSVKGDLDAARMNMPDLKTEPKSQISDNNKPADITTNPPSLDEKIVKFLIQYADSGQDAPQFNLGMRYIEGRGVVKDRDKAIEYLKKSAAQGNDDAKKKLNELGVKW